MSQLILDKPKQKFSYKTETDKKGNVIRYRCWQEFFKDEDSGKLISIQRKQMIKCNGQAVAWYPNRLLKKMSPAERKAIELPLKK
jgi:hypothetical protein